MTSPPFHYEVRFKLLAITDENELIPQFVNRIFKDDEPIVNRNKAFEAFEEFLSYKENQLSKENGNYKINQPIFIEKQMHRSWETLDERITWHEKFEKYKEEFEIYLILDNKDEIIEVYKGMDNELVIHRVASYNFDPQDILDNLMYEFLIYKNLGYDTNNKKNTVEHYGTDFYEGGEHLSLAFVDILYTPFIWNSDKEKEDKEHEELQLTNTEQSSTNLFEDIIKEGEKNTIEFKSSLLYNFKTKKAGASIKYIIAKSICGFLNSKNGGLLLIGVRDDKNDEQIQGLEYDFSLFEKNPKDKFRNEFDSLLQYYFPPSILPSIITEFIEVEGKDIFLVQIDKNTKPVMLNNQFMNKKEFFVRRQASTREITDIEQIIDYIFSNWIADDE